MELVATLFIELCGEFPASFNSACANDCCGIIGQMHSADTLEFSVFDVVNRQVPNVSKWRPRVRSIDPYFLFLLDNYPMARPLRIEYPGAYYHVTSRGN
jgi:hypothetical protein